MTNISKVVALESVKVVERNNVYYDKRQIMKEFNIKDSTADRLIKAFKEECIKDESIFPQGSYIELTKALKWCNVNSFIYYLHNKTLLDNIKTRKYVKRYVVGISDYMPILE